MSSYEALQAAISELWAEEVAELERAETVAQAELREARAEIGRLRAEIHDAHNERALLSEEVAALPNRLMHASLAGDEAKENTIRRRYSELQGEIDGLEARLEAARAALREYAGDAPDDYLARLQDRHDERVHRARANLAERMERGFPALVEALTARVGDATGYPVLDKTTPERRQFLEAVRQRLRPLTPALGIRVKRKTPAAAAGIRVVKHARG